MTDVPRNRVFQLTGKGLKKTDQVKYTFGVQLQCTFTYPQQQAIIACCGNETCVWYALLNLCFLLVKGLIVATK